MLYFIHLYRREFTVQDKKNVEKKRILRLKNVKALVVKKANNKGDKIVS